jgi:hypothetical protein
LEKTFQNKPKVEDVQEEQQRVEDQVDRANLSLQMLHPGQVAKAKMQSLDTKK